MQEEKYSIEMSESDEEEHSMLTKLWLLTEVEILMLQLLPQLVRSREP